MGKIKTYARSLEKIVPKNDKSIFYLKEDEPEFDFAVAPPVTPDAEDMAMGGDMGEEPMEMEPGPEDPGVEDEETPAGPEAEWPVKKFIGLLRYCGAMASQIDEDFPQQAYEIMQKIKEDIDQIAEELAPFVDEIEPEDFEDDEDLEDELEPESDDEYEDEDDFGDDEPIEDPEI